MKRQHIKQRGFTLIEVVVALFILSFALVSIMQLLGTTTQNMVTIKKHQVAHWVGMNYLVQMQIDPTYPKLGQTSSKTEMADATWYLDAQVIATPNADIRKILIQVFDVKESKTPLFSANGYKSKLIQW